MARMIAVFLLTYISASIKADDIPCPGWDGGLYVNRKCFKSFNTPGHTWYSAKDHCLEPNNGAQLAEPRTLEEAELVVSMAAQEKVWMGAIHLWDVHRFDSDNLTMDFFGLESSTWPGSMIAPTCVLIDYGEFTPKTCDLTVNTKRYICEKAISQSYVISLVVASDVTMDIVANENTTYLQELVVIHRDVDQSITHQLINVSNTDNVKMYRFPTYTLDEWKAIQTSYVEIVTSHPMTLTLWYDTDPVVTRSFLHPFLEDLGRTFSQPSYFIITTTSLYEEHFALSVVSKDAEIVDVEVDFKWESNPSKYIMIDSMQIMNPRGAKASLSQYNSFNINGTVSLDGTEVVASHEVAVYVIIFVDGSNEMFVSNVSSVHQMLPIQIMSFQYFTFPSKATEGTGEDIYKLVALHSSTVITISDTDYDKLKRGSTMTFLVPNNQSFLFSGNKRFQLYRTFNGSWDAETENVRDVCSTPILPRDVWQSQYTVPIQWTDHVTHLTIHVIIDRDKIGSVYLDDEIIELQCGNITGSDNVACSYDPHVAATSKTMVIRAPVVFGAYMMWVSGGLMSCSNLGLDWYGDWEVNVNNPHHNQQSAETTTTATTSTTVTVTTSPTTSRLHSSSTTATTSTTSTLPTTTVTTASASTPTPDGTLSAGPTTPSSSGGTESGTSGNQTCYGSGLIKRTNLTSEELDEVVDKIRLGLYIDVTKTSAFFRSKTSAIDPRPSSTGIGYGGIAFVVIILAAIVISDVITLFTRPSPPESRHFKQIVEIDSNSERVNALQ